MYFVMSCRLCVNLSSDSEFSRHLKDIVKTHKEKEKRRAYKRKRKFTAITFKAE